MLLASGQFSTELAVCIEKQLNFRAKYQPLVILTSAAKFSKRVLLSGNPFSVTIVNLSSCYFIRAVQISHQ